MTAKEYLEQVGEIDSIIKRLERERDELRADLYRVGSPANMGERVQSSKSGDTFFRLIAKIDKKDREIQREMVRLVDMKNRIIRQIERLKNEDHRAVLIYRYVMGLHWNEIAEQMHYSIRSCHNKRDEALRAFAKVMNTR